MMRTILHLALLVSLPTIGGCSARETQPAHETRADRHDDVPGVSAHDRERLIAIANIEVIDSEARSALDELRRADEQLVRHRERFPESTEESRAARRAERAAYRAAVRRALDELPAETRAELRRADLRATQLAQVLAHEAR